MVYLIGAGPGDPGLITLRGVTCLRRADMVLYDYLVNPRILAHAPGAEKICLGKHGRTRIWTQDEINAKLVDLAAQGLVVARLKGGDPAVFARTAEELATLRHAGIPYEIVPGVTSGLAASSFLEIPVTHRDWASAVALVTGQERPGKDASLNFRALAVFPGTLIFYMAVTTAAHWTRELIAAGKPGGTPALVVRRCTLGDQRRHSCRLDEVADVIERHRLRPPVIVVVGEVARLAPAESWFESRPLCGQSVLVTRPREQAEELLRRLEDLGAECCIQSAITIGPPADWAPVDAVLERLGQFDWIVFTSGNGVRGLLERLFERGGDLRRLGSAQLAVVGPGTARALAEYRLVADLLPSEKYQAEGLADALAEHVVRRRVLLVRANRGRDLLGRRLRDAGALVTEVVAYESVDITEADPDLKGRLAHGEIDWVTVTSSASARALHAQFGSALSKTRLISISPLTSQALRELGWQPAAEASAATMEGLVEALVKARETQPATPSPSREDAQDFDATDLGTQEPSA